MDQEDFLVKEYEMCFGQQRYYDTRQSKTLAFLFSLAASVATAQFAILKYLGSSSDTFYLFQTFLSAVVFAASALTVMTMVQNRLYFVFATRQLNAIRSHFLKDRTGFRNNQLWIKTDYPAVKPHSVHMYQLRGAVLMSSLFASSALFSLCAQFTDNLVVKMVVAGIALVGVALAEERWVTRYLHRESQKSADEAVGHAELAHAEAIQVKPAALVATLFLSVVAVAHLLRLLFQVQFTVASTVIPMWASVLAVLGAGALAVWLWREHRESPVTHLAA